MFKALVKKQLLEVNKGYYTDQKTGARKTKKSTLAYVLFFVGILVFIGVSFVAVCNSLIGAFHPVGLDWLYFSITVLLSIMLGAFGSVFNTYAGLYKAEDNELLLSMPIKPVAIVTARLIGVFLMGLMYELPVIIPAIVVYWCNVGVTISTAIIQIISIFVIAFFVLSLSCILGYAVAVISTRIKSKAFVSAIASVLFMAAYYFAYFKANKMIKNIVENADVFGQKIKSSTFFLYHLGNGFVGSLESFAIFSGIIIAIVLAVFLVVNKSFIRLASTAQAQSKGKLKAKVASAKKPKVALLKKELKRFTSSTVYLLNCGLGVIAMPVAAVLVLIKANTLTAAINQMSSEIPHIQSALPVLVAVMVCTICTLNAITAPSVSFEGKNIWVTQSLPVDTRLILEAKVNLGVTVNSVPALISALIMCIAFKVNVLSIVLILTIVWAFVWMSSRFGLVINLKFPNLNWTSETVPVKQSISLMLTLVIGWVISAGMLLLAIVIVPYINVNIYMAIIILIFGVANIFLNKWINEKGTVIFERL